jgi:hypothetical protein
MAIRSMIVINTGTHAFFENRSINSWLPKMIEIADATN